MDKTLLITKLKTTNIGNQALSDEVIKLYEAAPEHLFVAGRPEGLFGYSIEKLVKSKNAVKTFEGWADGLLKRLQTPSAPAFKPTTRRVELLSFNDFKVKNDSLFQSIKNIFRRHVHLEGAFAKAYSKRFAVVSSVDRLIYSGAGEVGDNNIFLRQLLELRVAQKMGKKTYAINQSVEVGESPMKEICGLVYSDMTGIVVRGEISKTNMMSMGVNASIIQCFPDSAFLNATPKPADVERMAKQYSITKPSVGINLTKVADDMKAWGEIVALLKSLGYTPYFISNDPYGDKAIGEKMAAKFGVIPILDFINYPDYSALLANFSFIISCRLHTNELSLTAGTPIIGIEGSRHKTREVFGLAGYPLAITNAAVAGWPEKIKEYIQTLHKGDSAVTEFVRNLDRVRALSRNNRIS